MTDFMTMKGQSLSLSGLRMGPLDPKSKVPKVGTNMQYQVEDPSQQKIPKFLNKERSGFSGGFKIPEEQRRAKLDRKIKRKEECDSDDHEEVNKNDITKDEIMQHLNLGASQAAGSSKHGAGSKTALAKDLIENLEKELEKLKRTEENIKVRKHIAIKGDRSILDETKDDRQKAKNKAIEDAMKAEGNDVIFADQKRIQLKRHRVGQLDSVKRVPYEELETMREETALKLKELQEQYWGSREGNGSKIQTDQINTPGATTTKGSNLKNKNEESLAKPKFDYRNLEKGKGGNSPTKTRSRSKSVKRKQKERSPSPEFVQDPRQSIYQAKFEKYLANKKVKQEFDRKNAERKPQDFDIYTKGLDSPSKMTKRFRKNGDPTQAHLSGKYNEEDLVPQKQDQAILLKDEIKRRREAGGDPFHNLGVSGKDKMTFFLLKWVFNAIKRESADDDKAFKGKPYISKADLIKQLSKNPELMQALGYETNTQLSENVKLSPCKKDGYFMWSEFLDFVFLRDSKPHERVEGSNWWNNLDPQGQELALEMEQELIEEEQEKENLDTSNNQLNQSNISGGMGGKVAADRRPVKMNASMNMLQNSRQQRAERDVDEEFRQMAAKKTMPAPKAGKKVPEYESMNPDLDGDGFGFQREKSKNLLLGSQVEVMRQVFDRLDKYNEGILRRSDFLMALRTDPEVIHFIDCEALKKAYSTTTLTLDMVMLEIEKDEMFEIANQSKKADTINHKEFLTWREFMNYFNDYQEIEQRNKKQTQQFGKQAQTSEGKKTEDQEGDPVNEMQTLMEQEKARKLQELPRLRPADQIDISEEQLQLIKDIFDSIPHAQGGKDTINVLSFFLTIRKDPQIRKINTAIARDPEGCSRIQRETFQEVFDRMERELQQKQVDWSTIVEFFTKRGRPLSKDDIYKLVEEDRIEREALEMKQRAEEEAERRRNQRLMGEMEEDQEEDNEFQDKYDHAAQSDKEQDEEGDYNDKLDREEGDEGSDEYEGNGTRTTRESDPGATLSGTKINSRDYAKRAQSAKVVKKGKYGVTVPQPFGFDMRDKSKTKTIRERKIDEMIAEKKVSEDNLIKTQFRSKPIPPAVLIPRYQSIIEADAARKEQVRAQSLKNTREREAPFSFWARDMAKQQQTIDPAEKIPIEMRKPSFKANPIPGLCKINIYEKKLLREEQERRERIYKNAEIKFSKSKMPPRMQQDAEKRKNQPKKVHEIEYSFQPQTSKGYDAKAMKRSQSMNEKKLKNSKIEKKRVVCKSPNFVKRDKKIIDKTAYNEGNQVPPLDKATAAMKALAEKTMKSQADNVSNPPSTKASQLAASKRRQEISERSQKALAQQQAEIARKEKQTQLKKQVQAGLKSMFSTPASEIQAKLSKEKKEAAMKLEADNRAVIEKAVKKGRSGPMLFETTAADNAASKNLSQFRTLEKLMKFQKEMGLDPRAGIDKKKLDDYDDLKAEMTYKDQIKKGKI